MSERPIIFSAPMVRALLAGTKVQTRRVVKPQPESHQHAARHIGDGDWQFVSDINQLSDSVSTLRCPHGQPGARLWVREAWSGEHCYQHEPPSQRVSVMTPDGPMLRDVIWYWADGDPDYGDWERPRPSIHMPRWASRITIEVTGVRVERLQDISQTDAIAEGVNVHPDHHGKPRTSIYSPVQAYAELWESINGPGSWDANPFVWAVEFKRVTP